MSQDIQAFLDSKKPDEGEAKQQQENEQEIKGDWKLVDLPEVEVVTGEEGMKILFANNGRLFRWDDQQWKQRGTGDFKILKNTENQSVRFVMRQDQTKKVVANFLIEKDPLCSLISHAGSDRAWLWMCQDYSDGKAKMEKLALRLNSSGEAQAFKTAFNDAKPAEEQLEQMD